MFYRKEFLAKKFRTNLPETCAQTPCAQTLRTNPAHKLRTHLAHKPCAQTPSTKSRLWQGGVCTRRTHKHPAHKVRAQAPRTKRTSPHKPHKLRTNPHKPHKPCAQKEFFSITYCTTTTRPYDSSSRVSGARERARRHVHLAPASFYPLLLCLAARKAPRRRKNELSFPSKG